MQEMDAALILTKQDVLIFFIKGDKRYIIKIKEWIVVNLIRNRF